MNDTETPSAVRQVSQLKPGESYAKAKFLPAGVSNPDEIRKAKRDLLRLVGPIVSRAKEREPLSLYRTFSIHAFTRDYDVIVAAVVVRDPDL